MSLFSRQHSPAAGETDLVPMLMVGVLAFPWALHALVVTLSALGFHPLSSAFVAWAILLMAASATAAAVRLVRVPIAMQATELGPVGRSLAQLTGAAALAVLGASIFAAVTLPVIAYDALAYRLPAIAGWLDAGRIAWVVTDDPVRNGYPLGQEAISAVVVAATGTTRFVALPSFFFVVAGALSIWHFAERLGVRRLLARTAAALFLLVPMVTLNAASAYVDASFAGAVVAFVLLSALAAGSARGDVAIVAAAGMAGAHALSLKGTGVMVVAAVVTASVVAAALAWFPERPPVDRRAVLAATLGGALALPGMFWALRDVAHTGNPLWPVSVAVAGRPVLDGVASMESILDVAHNTPASLVPLAEPARILSTWFERGGVALDFDARLSGLGLAWPLVAVPAIVLTLLRVLRRQGTRTERATIGVALVATALMFILQPMRWWPRYTIWLWGAGAAAIALTAESLLRAHRERLALSLLGAAAALAAVEGGIAAYHANGLSTAASVSAYSDDARRAPNAATWVDASFWQLGAARTGNVCRGAWKPGTDDANLDGVFAQISPRPTIHVVPDDDGDWAKVESAWRDAGCDDLLLFRGSPVLASAEKDPRVTVESAVAFDPLFVVRPRPLARLDARNESP